MQFTKIDLNLDIKKPVLALGADVKNTVCFAYKDKAFVSEVIGDLKEVGIFRKFQNAIQSIPRYFKVQPSVLAYDLHPEYFSVKYAASLPDTYKKTTVQHHHAHIASCMAENSLTDKKVIGVAFDGTGFGGDNTFWGAEFFICDYHNFQRRGHLKAIPLIGGEKAILEPWRLICFWLYSIYGDGFLNLKIDAVRRLNRKRWAMLKKMLLSGFNSPLSSSMGRLFDAVGALVLRKYKVRFEAEAAMALEKIVVSCQSSVVRPYSFKILKQNGNYIIEPALMFKEIISELVHKQKKEDIAYRFHLTVAGMIQKMCLHLREETGINKIILSGGVFQNKVLTDLSSGLLSGEGFNIFNHRKLPCSDVSISLGQAVIANYRR